MKIDVWTFYYAPWVPGYEADIIRQAGHMGTRTQPSRVSLALVFAATMALTLATLSAWGTL